MIANSRLIGSCELGEGSLLTGLADNLHTPLAGVGRPCDGLVELQSRGFGRPDRERHTILSGGAAMAQSASSEQPIGQVTHYFSKVGVMAILLSDQLAVGDRIHVRGHTTDFVADVASMQIEHESVTEAGPGDSVGVQITEKVRPGDMVYKA